MKWYDVLLFAASVSVAVWYITYCHMRGQSVFWKDEDDIEK